MAERTDWSALHHLAYIYSAIASVDGSVSNEELEFLCERLRKWESDLDERALVSIVMAAIAALGSDVDAEDLEQLEASLRVIRRHLDPATRGELLDDLIGIAGADGRFAPAEGDVLLRVRNALRGEGADEERRRPLSEGENPRKDP